MSEMFFVRIRGTQRGPFTITKLQELVKTGQMSRMNEVSPDGNVWRPASDYPEIFTPVHYQQATVQPAAVVQQPLEVSWYVTIRGQQNGPHPIATVVSMAQAGQITESDFVWHEQMHDWQPAGTVAELASCFRSPVAAAIAINQGAPNIEQTATNESNYKPTSAVTHRRKSSSTQGVNLVFASIASGLIILATIMVFLPWSSVGIPMFNLTQSGFQMVTGDFSSSAGELLEQMGNAGIETAQEQFKEEVDRAFLVLGIIVCLLAALALAYIHLMASGIATLIGVLLSLIQLGIGFPMASDDEVAELHSIDYGFWIFLVAAIIGATVAVIGQFMSRKPTNTPPEQQPAY